MFNEKHTVVKFIVFIKVHCKINFLEESSILFSLIYMTSAIYFQPLHGATQRHQNRKRALGRFHLRMRNVRSSFPALEWKRQDGPSAALLESPKKIRPGFPILVSFPSISSLWKAPSWRLTFKKFVATETKEFVTERAPPHGGGSQTNMAVEDVPRFIHSISILPS